MSQRDGAYWLPGVILTPVGATEASGDITILGLAYGDVSRPGAKPRRGVVGYRVVLSSGRIGTLAIDTAHMAYGLAKRSTTVE